MHLSSNGRIRTILKTDSSSMPHWLARTHGMFESIKQSDRAVEFSGVIVRAIRAFIVVQIPGFYPMDFVGN